MCFLSHLFQEPPPFYMAKDDVLIGKLSALIFEEFVEWVCRDNEEIFDTGGAFLHDLRLGRAVPL